MMSKIELFIMRRQKKILLKDIATYVSCSISLISRYENDLCVMRQDKIEKYEEFILTK